MRTTLLALIAGAVLAPSAGELKAEMSDDQIIRLAAMARREIVTLPNYGLFDDISFRIDGGKVTLLGSASRRTLKESAERVVSSIEGVDEVANEIEVIPYRPNDDRIRTAVYVAIYGNPVLSRYNPNRGSPLFRGRPRWQAG